MQYSTVQYSTYTDLLRLDIFLLLGGIAHCLFEHSELCETEKSKEKIFVKIDSYVK